MYGQGSSIITSNATGAGGAASVLGGIAVLPNTSGNSALLVLSIATIALGSLVVLSFVSTRIALRYFK
jgi:hypothetical protein